MKISILDQAVVSKGESSRDALNNTVDLAVFADKSGFYRFWIAEHHGMTDFASSAPEVVLSAIGQLTKDIRIGSGATLLPYYKPFKVAEQYHTLSALYPGRIDLGIGRAPGGPAEVSEALSDNYLKNALNMPELAKELTNYINYDNTDHKLKITPKNEEVPEVWMLGTSEKSAEAAGQAGLNYCFGEFMSNAGDIKKVLKIYKDNLSDNNGKVIVTITAFCAETTEKARDIAMSSIIFGIMKEREFGESKNDDRLPSVEEAKSFILTEEENRKVSQRMDSMIIGSQQEVGNKLERICSDENVDELMISTNTHLLEDKINSFRLIKEYLDK